MNQYPNDPTTGGYPPPPQYGQPQYPPQQGYPQSGPIPPYPQQPMPPGYPPVQPPQPQQAPKKKGKALWIILGLVIAVIACGAIANAGKSGSSTTPSSPSNSNSNSTQQQPPSKPTTWQTTHTYTGNGDKQTETFTVGNDWKIIWKCQGVDGIDAPLYVSIYNADTNEMADWSAVSTTCKAASSTTDSTEEHSGGNIYLKVISGIDWTITIQELK